MGTGKHLKLHPGSSCLTLDQLENDMQSQSASIEYSEADIDAEIARYARLLEQMDVLESDLQILDEQATMSSLFCRQAEAHTPRASPEIMP